MKPATVAAKQLIQRSEVVKAVPKLIAEWEHNRTTPIQSISVSPTPLDDSEYRTVFPVESVGKPNRPRTGIAKARLSDKLKAATGYRDYPQSSRFYVSTQDDVYSYWSSTQKSKLAKGPNNDYAFDAPVSIELIYEKTVVANKLVVGFETSYARPVSYYVEVTSNGSSWASVGGLNPALNTDGQIILWKNKSQWMDVPDYVNPASIRGVRVTVESMSDPYAHLDVLQLGARLENDLSDFVENYDAGYEMSEPSFIAPMGRASANVSSITLSNIDRRFNNENSSSVYKGLIDKKVKFKLDISLNATSQGGSSDERIRELTMWSDSWDGQEEESVTISLKDSSVILQETDMPKVFWENLTVGAIVWQTMDILGLSNYNYSRSELDSGQVVPYYWPSTEGATVWDEFSSLAEGTQTAIYFDEYDVMQIKTRKSMFAPGKGVDWNLDAVQNGQKLPDVESLSSREDNYINSVSVEYKPTSFKASDNGLPKMDIAWDSSESTLTLRSTDLTRDLSVSSTEIWVKYDEVAYWPYESLINVRGEIMRYKGKEYVWRKPGGGLGTEVVYSLEQQKAVDAKSDPNLVWANSWSGKLLLVERGVGGSGVASHSVRGANYTGLVTNYFNTQLVPYNGGIKYNDGTMTLVPPASAGVHSYYLAKHEAVVSSNDTLYGTRFRFPEQQTLGNNWATAGLWFAGDWGDAGFFLEISTTEMIDAIEQRQWRHELSLIMMPANAAHIPVVSNYEGNRKGWPLKIDRGIWYDLDIRHTILSTGNVAITAYINGTWAGDWFVDKNVVPVSQGKFGVFTRYQCTAEFEYLYAVNSKTAANYQSNVVDESSYLDLVTGGFTSGYIEREWRYGTYQSVNRGPAHEGGYLFSAQESRANYAYDEFGPVVHEVREFDVTFDESKVPVAHSYLEFSNTAGVVCTDYYADSFGAKFTLANTSRQNAILKGDDKLTTGNGDTITHNIFVYGRALYQDDSITITRKDEQSIIKRGLSQLTFNNKFIQTEAMATELADWVVQAWKSGSEEVNVSIFGNPFLQVGDYVTLNYPVKDMTPSTHKYIIVRKNNKFTQGLETNLVLRRLRF